MPRPALPCLTLVPMKARQTVPATRTKGSRPAKAGRSTAPAPNPTFWASSTFWGWVGPILITIFGGYLRFHRLGWPPTSIFDETYYVPDANSILHHGVEFEHVSNLNYLLAAGNTTNIFVKIHGHYIAERVAHPPLGKIMMAVGQWMFGLTPFGWRFTVALIGTVSILMVARIARRMTGSTLLGCIAGLLLALDGLELVLSRTALLDIFVMFWVLAAFGLLVIDRDRTIARLKDAAASGDPQDVAGPRLGIRWLRVGAGLCLGAACASKWNGVYFLIAFLGLAIAWDLGFRRAAGFTNWRSGWLRSDGKWLPGWFVLAPAIVYIASWGGWFTTSGGYDRNWAPLHGNHTPIWSTIDSWYQYNRWMLQYGVGLHTSTPYESNPVGWLVLARPIRFFWCTRAEGCPVPSGTVSEVLAIGTPVIWWGGTLALLFCLGWWVFRLVGDVGSGRTPLRDWRAGALLLGVAAGWLPWIAFGSLDNRLEFYYYAVAFDPFLVIAIALCLGFIIGPAAAAPGRRVAGAAAAAAYVVAALVNLAYLYPILTGDIIPYSAWLSRMWFHSWM